MGKFWSYYKEYLKLVKPYTGRYLVTWVLTILLMLVLNIAPFYIGSIIDSLSSTKEIPYLTVGLIVAVITVPLFLQPLMFLIKTRIFSAVGKDLSSNLFEKVMSLDYKFHTNRQTG